MSETTAAQTRPPIDVIELAMSIIQQGARRETQVSQLEIRALAGAICDFNLVLTQAAHFVHCTAKLGEHRTVAGRKLTEKSLQDLVKMLTMTDYLEDKNAHQIAG